MLKLALIILTTLFTPKPQTLTVKQSNSILKVSVLIRAKEFKLDPDTNKIVKGMIGCSGTYITPNIVLTAAHCFAYQTTNVWVRGQNEMSFPAQVLKISPDKDLALLLVISPKKHAFAKIAKTVRVGEGVYNVGSPRFFEFLVTEGIIASMGFVAKPFKGRYIVTTAAIDHGSSGGGAFNADGDLIGVNTLMTGIFGWSGISLAVDANTIREFLK